MARRVKLPLQQSLKNMQKVVAALEASASSEDTVRTALCLSGQCCVLTVSSEDTDASRILVRTVATFCMFCLLWQLHALASCMLCPLQSVPHEHLEVQSANSSGGQVHMHAGHLVALPSLS